MCGFIEKATCAGVYSEIIRRVIQEAQSDRAQSRDSGSRVCTSELSRGRMKKQKIRVTI
jgi:hypothetical protein